MVDRRIRLFLLWVGVTSCALGLAVVPSFASEPLAISAAATSATSGSGASPAAWLSGENEDENAGKDAGTAAELSSVESVTQASPPSSAPFARLGFAIVLLAVISALLIDWARSDATET